MRSRRMSQRYCIVSTHTYQNGWPDRIETGPPLWNLAEAERCLAASHAAIIANNRGPVTITRVGHMLTVAPFAHFGECTYRIVPDNRPITVTDPRPDDDEDSGVVCIQCGDPMTKWQARCFSSDDEVMCCCCFYGDSKDDCSGVGAGYRPRR